jgi:DNA-3-methyladenine glycosylase
MYLEGGVSYVYLCYGIHHLLNVVTGIKSIPHAILLRSIIPETGIKTMLKRRGNKSGKISGPGKLTKALGIDLRHNGISLTGSQVWLEENPSFSGDGQIHTTARIGVEYAGKDALLPYRFVLSR